MLEKTESKSGTMPHPRRASASATPEGRQEGGERQATRDEGGNERGRKAPCKAHQAGAPGLVNAW
jgi:hypothetical protein